MLIGLAHGSRHAQVGAGIDAVLAAVSHESGISTRSAYLDLTAPDLDTVAAALASAGERTAIVVPLLFTDAFHARIDVPAAVGEAAAAAGLDLRLAPILGTGDDVLAVIGRRLEAAGTGPDEQILLYAVGSSRPEANAAVAGLAGRLAAQRRTSVRVGFGTTQPHAADVLAEMSQMAGIAGEEGRPGTVVPLFVAPGLLLDAVAPVADAAGWRLADPLGTLLAPLVSHRYRTAVGDRRRDADRPGLH